MRNTVIFIAWAGLLLGLVIPIRSDASDSVKLSRVRRPVSEAGRVMLQQLEGCTDGTIVATVSRRVSREDLLGAMYGDDRNNRLVAIDISGYVEDPWPLVPYLGVFLEASQRDVASRAAGSLVKIIERSANIQADPLIPIDRQVAQIYEILKKVAANKSLELDMRIVAIRSLAVIRSTTRLEVELPVALYSDKNVIVRGMALDFFEFPLKEAQIKQVAKMTEGEELAIIRGRAVAMLCENALSHNVQKLSGDLEQSAVQLMSDEPDAEVIGPLLGCLARFPYSSRAELTDSILAHPDERVKKYWESLTQ